MKIDSLEKRKRNKRFISIKTKILGTILPVIIIIVTVLTCLSYFVSKNIIKKNAQENLKTSVESQSSQIEAWLEQNLKSLNVAKHTLEQMEFNEEELQHFLDVYYGFDSNFPEGLHIADKEGRLYSAKAAKAVILREPDAKGNYIDNGDFKKIESLKDNTAWQLFTAEGGEATAKIQDEELSIGVSNEGTADYSIQLVQADLPMKKDAKYKITFDAYADDDRTIKVGVTAPDHDYIRYCEDIAVELADKKQTYTYDFTMTGENDANGRLEFNLGNAGSVADVHISNVSLSMVHETEEPASEKKVDVTASEWFKNGLTRVNMGYTNAYTNESGEQIISACGMLKENADNVRVCAADLSLDKISSYVNGFVKMKEAESFLINGEDNTILAAHDTSFISKKTNEFDTGFVKSVGERISKNELGLMEISGNIAVLDSVKGTEWILVSYVPAKVIYKELYSIRNIMVLFGVCSLIFLTVIFERIIHVVIKPVRRLTDVIRAMTNGDFTIHTFVKNNDEIGVMSRCVEQFIKTMRNMITSVNGVSNILHNQADSSKDISHQMFSASKQQNQSMKELNATVEQLSASINGIAQSASTLAVLVTDTRDDGNGVNNRMKETVDVSRKGRDAMRDVSAAMGNINDSVKKLQLTIDKVENASEQITSITEVIGNIADETSLLSLNASIEAARAGEAGKGFAVVATEIGKLAQTSMDSVRNINELILEIKSSIGDVIDQAGESVSNINVSSGLIENATETFDVIFDNIVVVGNLVQKMIGKVDQVEDEARNVAAISQEQAASSEEIAASSDLMVDQANSLMLNSEAVKNESSELTDSAQKLAVQIEVFKV